jgi:hypothetical protein
VKGGGVSAQRPDDMRLDARAPLAAQPLFVGFRCAR